MISGNFHENVATVAKIWIIRISYIVYVVRCSYNETCYTLSIIMYFIDGHCAVQHEFHCWISVRILSIILHANKEKWKLKIE